MLCFLAPFALVQPTPPWERMVWNPRERGPLLIVAPQVERTSLFARLPREGELNVLAVAEALQRHLARTGTLSALVPDTIPLTPRSANPLPDEEILHALASTLNVPLGWAASGPTPPSHQDGMDHPQGT